MRLARHRLDAALVQPDLVLAPTKVVAGVRELLLAQLDRLHLLEELGLDLFELFLGFLGALLALGSAHGPNGLESCAHQGLDPIREVVEEQAFAGLGAARLLAPADGPCAAVLFVVKQCLDEHQHVRRGEQVGFDTHLSLFDALGDLDLTLAGEKRNGPHLPQVHPDGVAAPALVVETRALPVGFASLPLFLKTLLRLHDCDVIVRKHDHQVVELVRRDQVGWKPLVDLVVSDVAALLPDLDEGLNVFQVLVLHHLATSTLGGGEPALPASDSADGDFAWPRAPRHPGSTKSLRLLQGAPLGPNWQLT